MPKKDYLVEFRLQRSVAEELMGLYADHLAGYENTDGHEQLLSEHIKDMYVKLERMVRTMMRTAKLGLTHSEALAFYQTWSVTDMNAWPLANILVMDMLTKIEKRIS